jgi:hypothetical protein
MANRVARGKMAITLNRESACADRPGNRASITKKVPEGLKHSPSGGPNGSTTSHGTTTAYRFPYPRSKNSSICTAAVPPKGLRAQLSTAAMEPALLPGSRVSALTASLAGNQTPTAASKLAGEPPATCSSRTSASHSTPRRGQRPASGTIRSDLWCDHGGRCSRVARVVTQRENCR